MLFSFFTEVLYGKIEGIKDLITFESEDTTKFRRIS
jgi:hypothetical protein